MKCDWKSLIRLFPPWLEKQVAKHSETLQQELRLRIGRVPEMICADRRILLDQEVTEEDLHYCINAATHFSPWCSTTLEHGYITTLGGHRIGVCGEVVLKDGTVSTVKNLTSLCIRIARDFPGISMDALGVSGNILIIGRPGCGKTTFLRDMIRQISNIRDQAVAVVDERRELFPTIDGKFVFSPGCRTDVISGCPKSAGIDMMLRTMNPDAIAVDEITNASDCEALLQACRCGVAMIATAHAGNLQDFLNRPVYRPIVDEGIFDVVIILRADKTWILERMNHEF